MVTATPRKPGAMRVSNYRPISLTPPPAKLKENIREKLIDSSHQ